MKTTLALSCIAILFMLAAASADNSNDTTSSVTKPRVKREPLSVVRIAPARSKKSYGATPRSKYGPASHYHSSGPRGGYGPGYGKPGRPSKPKYGPSKYGPSKPYGPGKSKHRPQKHHGFKPSYPPSKYGSSYYSPQPEEEDYGFGEPPQSFGEPPVSTFSQSNGFSGFSGFGSSFDDGTHEYDSASFTSSPHKTYKRPSKKPYDFEDSYKQGYEEEDPYSEFGFGSGSSFSYEPTRYESHKIKKPKYKPHKHYGKDAFASSSVTFSRPKGYSSPFDTPDNYEAQGTGYPDETVPASDYFGAPLSSFSGSSGKYETFSDDIDSDGFPSTGLGFRKPEKEVIRERPKKKSKVVKVVSVKRKKPRTRQTDEGQIIFGGHYSDSPRNVRNQGYSDSYDSSYAESNVAYAVVPPDTNYINYKSANMGFSPQNVNDVFNANKRLEAGYQIELADSLGSPSQIGTIVAQAPNYPYDRETDHASEVKITKSLSHDYYAGTAPDTFYTSTYSPMGDTSIYRQAQDNVLPPNYFDFSNVGLSEKTSQKFRDIASISLRNEDSKSEAKTNYNENLRNHRT